MARFIWMLLVLCISVWIGWLIVKDPGLAFFSYQQWSLEMPLWFAVLAFFTTLFVFYLLWKLINSIDFMIYRFKKWLQWRSRSKSYSKTTRGFIELLEGRFKYAEHYLLQGIAHSEEPIVNYLALAYVSEEEKNSSKRDFYLRKAHVVAPDQDMVIGIVQAELQLKQGQLEQALATLKHLRSLKPKHRGVLKLLERVYVHMADWKQLIELLPALYKAKVINQDELTGLESRAYSEYLLTGTFTKDELQTEWAHFPRRVRKLPAVLANYTALLMHFPELAYETEKLIRKALNLAWHDRLMKQYGLLKTSDTKKQLANAEAWVKIYPKQALLYLTLARLSMRCQLWGKARTYYNESLHLESNPEVYLEYGKLLEQLGDVAGATRNYQEGLLNLTKH